MNNFELSDQQKKLKEEHGSPEEFAKACYKAIPEFISRNEAEIAIQKYDYEWIEAGANRCLRMRKNY